MSQKKFLTPDRKSATLMKPSKTIKVMSWIPQTTNAFVIPMTERIKSARPKWVIKRYGACEAKTAVKSQPRLRAERARLKKSKHSQRNVSGEQKTVANRTRTS